MDTPSLATDLLNAVPAALIAIALDGRVEFWNTGAQTMFGYSSEEAMGQPLTGLICPPAGVSHTTQMIQLALDSGLSEFEATDQTKVGAVVYTQSTIRTAPAGQSVRLVVLKLDITQHVYQRQVQSLEIKYRGLLEAAPDALVIVNRDGRIVLINSQTERLFGYQRGELLIQPIERLVPARFHSVHPGHRNRYFLDPHARPMGAGVDLFARRRDGTEFPAEISLSPIEFEGGHLAMAAVRDISDRKNQEEVRRRDLQEMNHRIQEANRLKSEFLANMSHELRTPLNAILGFTEVLIDGKAGEINEIQKEFLGDILTSSRHLLQLINDVLDLSRVEAGKMEFQPRRIVPEELLRELLSSLGALIGQNRLAVAFDIDPQLGSLFLDPSRLRQILYNLLSNAIKFTPEGGRIGVRWFGVGSSEFQIEVEDTGIGISEEDLSTLFVEFHQLDQGPTKKYQGTGLGLALTRRLVEAQGGRVGASSEPGKGSCFFVVLPRETGISSGR